MQEIIIKFVPDFSEMESGLDRLADKGKIDRAFADLFRKTNAEIKQRNEELKTSGKAAVTEMEALSKSVQDVQKNVKADAANKVMKGLGDAAEAATKKTRSLRAEIRANMEALALLEKQGDNTSKKYRALTKETAELVDRQSDLREQVRALASDTRNFDAVITAVNGLAGGFTLAQGAAGLFADENEEVNRSLLKIQSAMALAQGLQQTQAFLTEKNAFWFQVAALRQRAWNLVIGQSTGAMKIFRVVLASLGIGVILLLLGAVISNFDKLKNAVKGNSEGFQKFLKVLMFIMPPLALIIKGIQVLIANMERVKQVFSGSLEVVTQFFSSLGDAFQALISGDFSRIGDIFSNLGKTLGEAFTRGVNEEIRQQQEEARKKLLEAEIETGNRRIKIIEAQGRDSYAVRKKVLDQELELYRLQQKELDKDSKEYLEKQKEIADKEIEIQVAAIEQGKRLRDRSNTDRIAGLNADLIAAEGNAQKELDIRIRLVEAQRDVELQNAQLTANQRKLIIAKADQDISNLRLMSQHVFIAESLAIDQAYIEERLAVAKSGTQAELQNQIDLIEAKSQADQLAVLQSEDSEKLKEAKLKAIRAKAGKEIDALNLERLRNQAETAQRSIDIEETRELNQLNLIKDNVGLSVDVRKEAENQILNAQDAAAKKRLDLLFEEYSQGLISAQDYAQKREDLENGIAERQIKRDNAVAENRKQLEKQVGDFILSTTTQVSDYIFAQQAERRQADYEAEFESLNRGNEALNESLNQRREAELNNDDLTESQKASIAARYATEAKAIEDKKRRDDYQIKLRQFNADKQAAISQALINGALAVTKAIAEFGPPPSPAGIFAMAAAGVATGLQVASISSRQPPRFFRGTRNSPEGMAMVNDSGNSLFREAIMTPDGRMLLPEERNAMVFLPRGSQVFTAEETQAMIPNIARLSSPRRNNAVPSVNRQAINVNIDYKELASVMEKSRSQVEINLDERGFTKSVTRQGNTTRSLNNRFRVNK